MILFSHINKNNHIHYHALKKLEFKLIMRSRVYTLSRKYYSILQLSGFRANIILVTMLISARKKSSITIRTMMSASCPSVQRSFFYMAKILSNTLLDDNKISLTNALVDYSLDHHQGVIAHKSKALIHTLADKYPSHQFYNYYGQVTNNPNISCIDSLTDLRTLAELPVLNQLYNNFGQDIVHVQANIDGVVVPAGTYPGLKQTNPDWLLKIKALWDQMRLTNYYHKDVYYDQKSGMDMFSHSTSGSMGMISYDKDGNPIRFLNKFFTLDDLIKHDKSNISNIWQGLENDNLAQFFSDFKEKALHILSETSISMRDRHNIYQQYLWDNIQRHPKYNRSLSFVFIETADFHKGTPEFNAFAKEFQSMLGEKIYDLNKRGDVRDVTFAMLRAYKNVIDPKFYDRLHQLHTEGRIVFNKKFLEDLYKLVKHHVNHYT